MSKKDNIKIFLNELHSKAPLRKYETSEKFYFQFDEIWSIDLADFSDYKTSNNKRFINIIIIIDFFSKHLWATPLKKIVKKQQMNFQTF